MAVEETTPTIDTADTEPPKTGRKWTRPAKRPRHEQLDPHQARRAMLLIAPTIALLLIVIGYPVGRAVWMSFQQDQHLDSSGVFVQGGFAGLDNYKHWLLQRCGDVACAPGTTANGFWEVVWITVFFTVVSVAIEVVLGFWFAIIMNGKFRGRGLLRAAVLIPWA